MTEMPSVVTITLNQLYAELQEVSKTVNRIDTRLEAFNGRVSDVEEDVRRLETKVEEISKKVWGFSGLSAALGAAIVAVIQRVVGG